MVDSAHLVPVACALQEYENEEYLERLENGLSMLQHVDYIVAEVVDGLGDEVITTSVAFQACA